MSQPALVTPCYGLHDLFDSVELEDHRAARAICAACPTLLACMSNLTAVQRDAGSYGQPEGTWAGQLLIDKRPMERRTRRRMHLDDQLYDSGQARTAHAQYVAGCRDDWTQTGERVYQARKKRESRKKVA